MLDTGAISLRREGGVYVAALDFRRPSGRPGRIEVRCGVREAARELGYEPREVGATFNPRDPDAWWAVIEAADDRHDHHATIGRVERELVIVGGKVGRRIKRRFKKFGKRLGAAFRKFAKSKVLRTILKVAKKVIKNPIFVGVASALTGGAAAGPLIAASAAVNIIDVATKGKPADKTAARKLVKLSLAQAKQEDLAKAGKLPPNVKAKGQVKAGPFEGLYATPKEQAKAEALLRQVGRARKGRVAYERSKARARPIKALRQADRGATQRWLVELGGLQTW